jgi:hypothetical protein
MICNKRYNINIQYVIKNIIGAFEIDISDASLIIPMDSGGANGKLFFWLINSIVEKVASKVSFR